MASKIIDYTTDKVVELRNSEFLRAIPIAFADWTKIRLGFRYRFVLSAGFTPRNLQSIPLWVVGLNQGTTKLPLELDCEFFVGWRSNIGTWIWHDSETRPNWTQTASAWGSYGDAYALQFLAHKTGATWTTTTSYGPRIVVPDDADTPGTVHWDMHFFDVTKGSPNWSFGSLWLDSNNASSIDLDEFMYLAELETISPYTNYKWLNPPHTLAATVFSGKTLDSITMGWNRSHISLEVTDLVIVKFA